MQHLPIDDSPCHARSSSELRNRVKGLGKSRPRYSYIPMQQLIHFVSQPRTLPRPVAVCIRLPGPFPDRFQYQLRRRLGHPVSMVGSQLGPLPAAGLSIISPHRCGVYVFSCKSLHGPFSNPPSPRFKVWKLSQSTPGDAILAFASWYHAAECPPGYTLS